MQGYPRRRLQTRPRPATGPSEGRKARMVERPEDRTVGARRRRSTRACWPCQSCAGFGTGTTSDRSPNTPVSFAGVNRRTPTTCDLPKDAPWAARSVMSSPSRCVGGTIARFIATATRQTGGGKRGLTRWSRPGRCGWRPIRSRLLNQKWLARTRDEGTARYRPA